MKQLLALLFLASSLQAQELPLTYVDSLSLNSKEIFGSRRNYKVDVFEFDTSPLISWKQYKEFLNDMDRMFGEHRKTELMPAMPSEVITKVMNSSDFDNEPVTGVSWTQAMVFARWKTIMANESGIEFEYSLPYLTEWHAIRVAKNNKQNKLSIDEGIAEWTLNSMDESLLYFGEHRTPYIYVAAENDPPSMKRKIVIGASSLFAPLNYADYATKSYYQDSSYSHIGFRLVKRDIESDLDDFSDVMGDHIFKFWDEWTLNFEQEMDGNETYVDGQYIQYTSSYGQLHGQYTSHYANGEIKAIGAYFMNERIGTWKLYDSLRGLVHERYYTSPKRFDIIHPKADSDYEEMLRDSRKQALSRDADKLLKLAYVQERAVLWAKRYWTRVEKDNNSPLFSSRGIMKALESACDDTIQVFDTISDQFDHPLAINAFKSRLEGELVAIEIKEDYFFDLDRAITETRIIGFCPVIMDSLGNEVKAGWLYFPQFRKHLRQVYHAPSFSHTRKIGKKRMHLKTVFDGASNMDDLFFLRRFDYQCTHTSSVKGKTPIAQKGEKEEIQKERLAKVEKEHDFWLYIYPALNR